VPRPFRYLRLLVYSLATLVGFALLAVGTIAVIAEVKGTWHWSIHLESTISYLGVFVGWVLVALVPLTAALLLGRLRYE
jgi:hypothetical protein